MKKGIFEGENRQPNALAGDGTPGWQSCWLLIIRSLSKTIAPRQVY